MTGASAGTQRVTFVNANWSPGRPDGEAFELMVVTEDEQRHALPVGAGQMAALVALTQAAGVVLLWDPEDSTLVAANLLGEWVPTTWSASTAG
ncbi:hypothetical protein GCM10022197_38320 [Microlunatus spumicola]|uniref:Uncharacterized protein n=1 Tax=Microlunatus spumicola TaxID=81499 RepID=A0ABP6Y4U4_9ACTN